jgi:hypothetical protein
VGPQADLTQQVVAHVPTVPFALPVSFSSAFPVPGSVPFSFNFTFAVSVSYSVPFPGLVSISLTLPRLRSTWHRRSPSL